MELFCRLCKDFSETQFMTLEQKRLTTYMSTKMTLNTSHLLITLQVLS